MYLLHSNKLYLINAILMAAAIEGAQLNTHSALQSDSCYIDGIWHAAGDISINKCFICDPAVSQTSWTLRKDVCNIYGNCYEHGEQYRSGCAECDTGLSLTSWTVQSGRCVINDVCYDADDYHPLSGGAAICDPDLSQTSWTIPGDHCLINDMWMGDGMIHPTGCSRCDVAVSKTAWTPIEGCNKIILAALNEAHTGNLGGLTVADCLCNGQAAQAGEPGTWKAFLSGTARNARELIPGDLATGIEVYTLDGWPLWENWSDMFDELPWFTGAYLYTFNFTVVDEWTVIPNWYDARGWHGSYPDGTNKPGYNCQDWTSDSDLDSAACGELDKAFNSQWPSDLTTSCEKTLAVVCVRVNVKRLTDVGDDASSQTLPDHLMLSQNYPNPFNPSTTISFVLPRRSHVKLEVFNVMGEVVTTLISGGRDAGYHSVVWDGSHAASGVYVYRLVAGAHTETKKMLLLK